MELSSQELYTIIISMLRVLMGVSTDGQCKQRDRNPKKEPKRNARN